MSSQDNPAQGRVSDGIDADVWEADDGAQAREGGAVAPGVLYVVATPIGNLGDLTPRARAILAEADVVACEDTRVARRLFQAVHIAARGRLVSYHDHNAAQRAEGLVARLQAGASLALISDAGVPGCSDPGYRLVAAAVDAGLRVVPVPGACAAIAALSASGLPTDRWLFVGFAPSSQGKRRAALERLKDEPGTLCLYESPQRVVALLEDVAAVLGDRRVCLAREVTKRFEEFVRGQAADVAAALAEREDGVRGECVVLIEGLRRGARNDGLDPETEAEARRLVAAMVGRKLHPKDIKAIVAEHFGIPKKAAYALVLEAS